MCTRTEGECVWSEVVGRTVKGNAQSPCRSLSSIDVAKL